MQTISENEMITVIGGATWSGRKPANNQTLSTDDMTIIFGGGQLSSI